MVEFAANLTTAKYETFYANYIPPTTLTSVKNEVIYVNPHPVPPQPVNAIITTSKLEVLYGGVTTTQLSTLTAVKTEVLRSIATAVPYARLTTVKHETFYSSDIQDTKLTSTKKEVLYQTTNIYATAVLTAVKHEILQGGPNPCKLTATKKEVLRSLILGKVGNPRRLLVLWNPVDIGK